VTLEDVVTIFPALIFICARFEGALMKSYSARLADAIAHALITKSRKKWRSLQDDAQRKIKMSEATNNMNVGANSALPNPIAKQVDHLAIEGANKGEHRAPALAADITAEFKNQAGPRGETTEDENAGA
jgi:hypothetical protein